MFHNIITKQFKQIYNDMIDHLISKEGLSTSCKLIFDGTNNKLCPNCIYDPINQKSFNKYNGTGPVSFADGSVCPACLGFGKTQTTSDIIVNLALILDSKYWLNWGPNHINIPNIAAQTICDISVLPNILSCKNMVVIETESHVPATYSKAGFPTPIGLGDKKYILTNWTQP